MAILLIVLTMISLLLVFAYFMGEWIERETHRLSPYDIKQLEETLLPPIQISDWIREAERAEEKRWDRVLAMYRNPNHAIQIQTSPRFSTNYINPYSFDVRWPLNIVTSDQIRAMSMEEYRSFRQYVMTHGRLK